MDERKLNESNMDETRMDESKMKKGKGDKRKEANLRVKKSITDALFSLMHEKSLSDISITEIIKKSGVARVSFYRNYTSKEDVLVTLVRDILNQFQEEAEYDLSDYLSYRHVLRNFQYLKKYESYVMDMYRSGFGTLILEELNVFHEMIAGFMPARSLDKYSIYIYIGALYDTAMVWLQNGSVETPEEVARYFCKKMKALEGEALEKENEIGN